MPVLPVRAEEILSEMRHAPGRGLVQLRKMRSLASGGGAGKHLPGVRGRRIRRVAGLSILPDCAQWKGHGRMIRYCPAPLSVPAPPGHSYARENRSGWQPVLKETSEGLLS